MSRKELLEIHKLAFIKMFDENPMLIANKEIRTASNNIYIELWHIEKQERYK